MDAVAHCPPLPTQLRFDVLVRARKREHLGTSHQQHLETLPGSRQKNRGRIDCGSQVGIETPPGCR
jgi:hypothetical protein